MGIDIGKSGAISIVDHTGKLVHKEVMPLIADTELDVNRIADIIEKYEPIHCCLEKLHSRAHWGVKNNFNFGGQFYSVLTILSLMGVPYTLIKATVWQKDAFKGITPIIVDKKLDTKKMSQLACSKLFPKDDFTPTERAKKVHDGLTDATLIALYCKRNF